MAQLFILNRKTQILPKKNLTLDPIHFIQYKTQICKFIVKRYFSEFFLYYITRKSKP